MSDRLLVLVRHGQSEWNLKNLFTGWKDPDLTEQGITEAKEAGRNRVCMGLRPAAADPEPEGSRSGNDTRTGGL